MADAMACAGRVERLRALMAERGYDAVILRNNPDLRWLTGAEGSPAPSAPLTTRWPTPR